MTAKTIYSKISALRTQPEMAQPVRTPAPSPLAVLAEAGIHLLLAAVLFVPGLQVLFSVSDLSVSQLITVGTCAFLPTAVLQLWKVLREFRRRFRASF